MVSISSTNSANSSARSTFDVPNLKKDQIGRRWFHSLALGAAVNVATWLTVTQVFSVSLATKEDLAVGGNEVQIPLVLLTTLVATSAAGLGRAIAGKLLRSPSLPWAAVTVAVGLASLMGPASAAVDGRVQRGLSTMHVATAAVVLGAHLRPRAEHRVD